MNIRSTCEHWLKDHRWGLSCKRVAR